MLAILATLTGCQGTDAYRVMAKAALRVGVTPVEIKEVTYQAVAYLGIGRVLPFFAINNEILKEDGVSLPLEAQAKTNEGDETGSRNPGAGRYFRGWLERILQVGTGKRAVISTAGWQITALAIITREKGWTICRGK